MKLGLDIHGVIDSDPARFIELAREIKEDGGSVYILTGRPIDETLMAELNSCGFARDLYDAIFSIQDSLDANGVEILGLDKYGRNHYPDEIWNSAKGFFCKKNEIDLHIDNSIEYKDYFSTPFAYFDGEEYSICQI